MRTNISRLVHSLIQDLGCCLNNSIHRWWQSKISPQIFALQLILKTISQTHGLYTQPKVIILIITQQSIPCFKTLGDDMKLVSWYASSACPQTISDHLQLHPPTLWCHSDAHCVSSHNHATPVAGLNSDQCLISLDLVPMSWATTYLSFSPYATFA